jgi:hypothetical protein
MSWQSVRITPAVREMTAKDARGRAATLAACPLAFRPTAAVFRLGSPGNP